MSANIPVASHCSKIPKVYLTPLENLQQKSMLGAMRDVFVKSDQLFLISVEERVGTIKSILILL